jgi:hypothetical protein
MYIILCVCIYNIYIHKFKPIPAGGMLWWWEQAGHSLWPATCWCSSLLPLPGLPREWESHICSLFSFGAHIQDVSMQAQTASMSCWKCCFVCKQIAVNIHSACLYTYMHACLHTYIRAYVRTYMHACMHTYLDTDNKYYSYLWGLPLITTFIHICAFIFWT